MKYLLNKLEQFKQCISSIVMAHFTTYKIVRDHSNKTGVFVVNVPEARQYGFGVQFNIKGTLYGLSIHS